MAGRYKRATAPLDATARERLWTAAPGGSSAAGDDFLAAAELGELVESFYEGGSGEMERAGRLSGLGRGELWEMLDSIVEASGADLVAERVRVEVEAAVRLFGSGADGLGRKVVGWLRERGFDAGLCKSWWEAGNRIPAGCHEYIDVIAKNTKRYIVEINIAGEFEIARPTARYVTFISALPKVFVAPPEVLRNVVNIMCAAAKESIRSAGMHIPPWRTKEYMQEKWFSSYKRSTSTDKIHTEQKVLGSRFAVTSGAAAVSNGFENQKFCRMELAHREVTFAFKGM